MKIYKCNICAAENVCVLAVDDGQSPDTSIDPFVCPYTTSIVRPDWKEITGYPEQLKELIQAISGGEK